VSGERPGPPPVEAAAEGIAVPNAPTAAAIDVASVMACMARRFICASSDRSAAARRQASEPRGNRLHNHWLVQNVARRNMPARNRNAARALRDDGPEGAMLWTAATASMRVACLAWVVGFALLLSSGAEGTSGDIGGWLILVALLFGHGSALRVLQRIRAGRAYRANRSNLGP
jgi:hypothetical protein